MKKILFLISFCLACFNLIGGGLAYADDITSSNVNNVSNTSSISNSTITSTNKSYEVGTTTTTEKLMLGQSNFNVVVSVSTDDMFTSLETLLDAYTTEQYAPGITTETKSILKNLLTSLIIGVVSGDGSYTLETFKNAFIQILVEHGINVTDEVIDAITKYAVHYLADDLQKDETDDYLVWIGGTLGMMTTLFITSQMGGVHRA